jgi:phosphomevalonate kinase
MTIKVSAPGKLVIAGEWAMLEMGNPGLIAAVDKRLWIKAKPANEISITIKDFGIKDLKADFDGKLKWKRDLKEKEAIDTQFIKGAIEITLKYLQDLKIPPKRFRIDSWSDQIEIGGQKIGFGSSAASVVATVAALLKLHGQDIESQKAKELIYKLATIAHYLVQGKLGSGFDVAASTFGGIFVYKRFDPTWLVKQVENRSIKEIVTSQWPGLYIEQLEIPKGLRFLVCWTKSSASTTAMIRQMERFKTSQPSEYNRIYDNIANLVKKLIVAWKRQNKKEILAFIKKNEIFLRELTKKSGVPIETAELKMLSDIAERGGGAGKLSGAGGGDCGIAICFDKSVEKKIVNEWSKAGLLPLNVKIDRNGVKIC